MENDKNLEDLTNVVYGLLKNLKRDVSDVFSQLSYSVREQLGQLANLLEDNPLIKKEMTAAFRKGSEAVHEYLNLLVKEKKISEETRDNFIKNSGTISDAIKRLGNVFKDSTENIQENIHAKKEEIKHVKRAIESSEEYRKSQENLSSTIAKESELVGKLNVHKKIYDEITKKEIPSTQKKIQETKEQIEQNKKIGKSNDEMLKQLRTQEELLKKIIDNKDNEIEIIRTLQKEGKRATEQKSREQRDIANLETSIYKTKQQEIASLEKQSSRFSDNIKGYTRDALINGEQIFGSLQFGFKQMSKQSKERSTNMAMMSLQNFNKDVRLEEALEKKREDARQRVKKEGKKSGETEEDFSDRVENAGMAQKLTESEKEGALAGRGKDLIKGLLGSLGEAFKGLFSKGIGMLMEKVAKISGEFVKMLEPLNKTFNVIKPLLDFFEIILGTWGEMMEGILGDMYSFRKEMTMSAGMAAETASNLQMVVDSTVLGKDAAKDIRASWDAVVEYTNSYVTDLGKSNDQMNDSVLLMAKISKLTGISAQESASFVTQMNNGLDMSTLKVNKMVTNLKTDAQSAGLNFKVVMQDVAKEGSRMAMYGEKISTGILKAAVRARELGGSLKTWTSLMDGFGDSWEGVVGFATDFNRLAGGQVMDAFALKSAQVTGDVEKVQNVVVGAMKNVKNEADLRGHLGKRFQKLLGIDDDEYAKLVERVHVEKVMEPALKNMDNLMSSMKGGTIMEKMFGSAGMGKNEKKMLEKSVEDWKKGMLEAGKNVDKEMAEMEKRSMVTAAQDAVKSGLFGSIEEFEKGIRAGDEKAAQFFQKAMTKSVNFPDFKNMEEALEESMNPQERMEVMIKEIARDMFPMLLKVLAFISEGLAEVVDFLGVGEVAKEMRKVSGALKVSASAAESTGAKKDFTKMYKSKEMENIFKSFLPDEKMANIEDTPKLMEQLIKIQKETAGKTTDNEKAANENATAMLKKLERSKTAEFESSVYKNQANTGEKAKETFDESKISGQIGKFAKDLEHNGGVVADHFSALGQSTQGLVQLFEGDMVRGFKNLFGGLMKTVFLPIKVTFTLLSNFWEGIMNTLDNAWEGLKKLWDGVINFDVSEIFGGIIDIIAAPFKGMWDFLADMVKDIFGKIGESVFNMVGDVLDKINPIKQAGKGIDAALNWLGLGGGEKQAGDIAFGVGEVTHVMDNKKQVWKLDPQDRVVASTNFDFNRDNIKTGSALPKGSLVVSGDMTTSGKSGSGKFIPKDKIPQDKQNEINSLVAKAMDTFTAEQESGTPLIDLQTISSAGANIKRAKKPDGFISPLNEFTLMSQGAGQPWSQKSFAGGGTYAKGGCGPTSIAMIASSIKGKVIPPDVIGENNKYMRGRKDGVPYGSSASTFPKVYSSLGIGGAKTIEGLTSDQAKGIFSSGNIISGRVPNHFVAFWGISQDGSKILVGDPGDSSRIGNVVQPFAREAGKKGRRVNGTQTIVPVGDIAFSSGDGLKWLMDKEGNVYELSSNEGALISQGVGVDPKLKSKQKNFLSPGSIFEKIKIPPWWQQEASKYNIDLGNYIEDINFPKFESSPQGWKVAKLILKNIGYQDKDFLSDSELEKSGKEDRPRKSLFNRLYNELMYGVDPNVKKGWRQKNINWSELKKSIDSFGDLGEEESGGSIASISDIKSLVGLNPKAGDVNANNPQRNMNPGNIRYYGEGSFAEKYGGTLGIEKGGSTSKKGDFAKFPTEEAGFAAIIGLFKTSKYSSKSIADAMMMYAPPVENDTSKYIKQLQDWTGLNISKKVSELSEKELVALARGISKKEGYWAHTGVEPPMINIADAYFGKGDVLGIMTSGGYYSPKNNDAVAVGTSLPNARTNTKLQEGELSNYLRSPQSGGGSVGMASSEDIVVAMKQIASLLRRQNTPNTTKAGNVYLDGMSVGRVIQPNISGHGNNLNGG